MIQLMQSPFLSILPDQRVHEILKEMGRPADEPISKTVGREICQRASVKAMLAGSIAKLGGEYLLGLDAVNCQTGDLLASEQETVQRELIWTTTACYRVDFPRHYRRFPSPASATHCYQF
jgi:hypothetical protein